MAKKQKDLVYPSVVVLIKTFWKYLKLKFDFAGVENIPTNGGAILAINHVGYLDFALAGTAVLPVKGMCALWPSKKFLHIGWLVH